MSATGQPPPVEVVHSSSATLIRLRGVIDEHFDRNTFIEGLATARGPVVIDVDGVPRLTSFGVREFMTALRQAPRKSCFFVRCHPSMVAQFNSIPQFGRASQIVTLYCPYACPECDEDFEVLVDVRGGPPTAAPAAKCPACGATAEFDDIEEFYFAYVAARPPISLPRSVEALIDGGPAHEGRALRVEKTVEGELTALWLHGHLGRKTRLRRQAEGLEGTVVVVFTGVESIDPAGAPRLDPLLGAPDCNLYVARLPLSLAEVLIESPHGLGRSTVVAPTLRTQCPTCTNPVELEVLPGEGAAAGACEHCQSAARVELSPAQRALVARLPLGEPSRSVRGYLQAFFGPRAAVDLSAEFTERNSETTIEPLERIGDYEILRSVGVVGVTELLLARRVSMEGFEKKLVIARVRPEFTGDAALMQRFLREVRTAAKLVHAHIVQIYDLGKEGESYFVAMDHVRGMNLLSVLALVTRFRVHIPVEIACRIIADVAVALDVAHSLVDDSGNPSPVLHRGLSPHNVLLSVDGMAKVTGFGLAGVNAGVEPKGLVTWLEDPRTYVAPEALTGGAPDPCVDVFAAGMMLYVCLTGEDPWASARRSPSGEVRSIPPVTEHRAVPEPLAALVAQAIAREPEARIPTARALQRQLEAFLADYGKPSNRPALARWLDVLITEGQEQGGVTIERGRVSFDVTRGGIDAGAEETQELALDPDLAEGLLGLLDR